MRERRKVERKVIEQLTFLETLMDTIPQLVSWKDVQGRYLGANRSYTDFFDVGSRITSYNVCYTKLLR